MATCIEPTPEQLAILSEIQDILVCPHTPVGRRLFDLGYETEAFRRERCGHRAMRRCEDGHVTFIAMRCGQAFCLDCAIERANSLAERWAYDIDLLERATPRATFDYADIYLPLPSRDMPTALDFFHSLSDYLPARHFKYFAGWDGSTAIMRVLSFRDEPNTVPAWRSIPDARVDSMPVPIYRLSHFFKNVLLAIWSPKSTADITDHEISFFKIRRFRAQGLRISPNQEGLLLPTPDELEESGQVEELSVEGGKSSTDKSHRHIPKCPECGKRITAMTGFHAIGTPPQAMKWRSFSPPKDSE